MPSFANKHVVLSVIMLDIAMLNVMAPRFALVPRNFRKHFFFATHRAYFPNSPLEQNTEKCKQSSEY
jgi:hypothetical protein